MKEAGDVGAVNELFFETQFRHYTFTIQVKARVFNDEPRLSFACIKVVPHSFAAENKQLLKRL